MWLGWRWWRKEPCIQAQRGNQTHALFDARQAQFDHAVGPIANHLDRDTRQPATHVSSAHHQNSRRRAAVPSDSGATGWTRIPSRARSDQACLTALPLPMPVVRIGNGKPETRGDCQNHSDNQHYRRQHLPHAEPAEHHQSELRVRLTRELEQGSQQRIADQERAG